MGLIRFGDHIELLSQKCNISNLKPEDISGINRDKEFFEPSRQVGEDTSNYKNVPPGYFACNLMHVGRDVVLPIALNTTSKTKVVSPAYTIFKLTDEDKLLSKFLFMLLKSEEKDRFFWFHCDSSVRDGMDWDAFCDIELDVPPIEIQRKYVAIYESLLANLHAYENKLEELKLVCDCYIEKLRRNSGLKKVGDYVQQYKEINSFLKITKLVGLVGGEISKARTSPGQNNLSKFQIIYPDSIVYPPPHFGEIGTIGIVKKEPVLMSPMYIAFRVKENVKINMEYLLLWFRREEFKRYAFFQSSDSVRDTFDFEKLSQYKIPIPSLEIQNSIVKVFNAYNKRKEFVNKLKDTIKNICPIIVRGAILEGEKNSENLLNEN